MYLLIWLLYVDVLQRIYNLAIETGVKIIKTPRLEELDVLELLLTQKITVKEPPKVALSRVKFTKFLAEHYGISEELEDRASNEGPHEDRQSQRRPLLGPSPG